jgi:hypothetical protein
MLEISIVEGWKSLVKLGNPGLAFSLYGDGKPYRFSARIIVQS